MKTLFLGILFLGFATLGYSQSVTKAVTLEDVVIEPINLEYLNRVKDKNTPEVVKKLETQAARFIVSEDPTYDKNFYAYQVEFKESSNRGSILATYDQEGRIIKSFEKFNDIKVPYVVRNAVFKAYPDWKIQSDTYTVSYIHNKDVKKIYKLKIVKDNKKKTLRVTPRGQLI